MCIETEDIAYTIFITDEQIEIYIKRILRDWSEGKVCAVFKNRNMKSPSFNTKLINHLSRPYILIIFLQSLCDGIRKLLLMVTPRYTYIYSQHQSLPVVWNNYPNQQQYAPGSSE
jgi:glutathionylspermidine synthase